MAWKEEAFVAEPHPPVDVASIPPVWGCKQDFSQYVFIYCISVLIFLHELLFSKNEELLFPNPALYPKC